MSERPTFKAKIDPAGRGHVYISDQDISDAVSGFSISCHVGQVNTVTLELIGTKLDLDIDIDSFQVKLDKENE